MYALRHFLAGFSVLVFLLPTLSYGAANGTDGGNGVNGDNGPLSESETTGETEILENAGDPTIEFTYIPPLGSFEDLKGKVLHVEPAEYRVAVYIYVVGGWWTKPFWATPLTRIKSDGSWVCDITTGGVDEQATEIIAFLVPADYEVPLGKGEPYLLDELYDNSVALVETTR